MQRKSLFKGLLTTAFAAAMAVMVSLPAKAAPAAPALSIKNTVTSDKHVTGYTFSFPELAKGNTIYFNVYKTDPKNSLTGYYTSGTIDERNTYAKRHKVSYYDQATEKYYYYDEDVDKYYYTEYVYDEEGYDESHRVVYVDVTPRYSYEYGYEKLATPVTYDYFTSSKYYKSSGSEYTLNITDLTPGTYQVTATLYDGAGYSAANNAYKAAAGKFWAAEPGQRDSLYQSGAVSYEPNENEYYSAASAPITITVKGGVTIDTAVTSTSVQLDFNPIGVASGYEVYRKAGKKFVKIATTSKATYLDNGLVSKTKYTYKVKPFYYDSVTGVKTMGAESQISATTNGSALNLKAQVQGTKNIVLSWTKIAGATKYEIYRSTGYSNSTVTKNGQGNGFEGYELVKTLSKGKKKYVDKKATSGETYTYLVRAVLSNDTKKNSKKQLDVKESTDVSLKFGFVDIYAQGSPIEKANGSKVVQWAKVSGATGYVVEKYNDTTGNWDTYRTLGKKGTKVTLPAATVQKYVQSYNYTYTTRTQYPIYAWSTSDTYRICAVKGSTRSDAVTVDVQAKLPSVNNVKAVKTANGIQVSWDAVPGAAYYKVYRVKADSLYNNKDAGYYTLTGDREPVKNYVNVQPLGAPVDPVAYNLSMAAKAKELGKSWDSESDGLEAGKTYYYQNYSYATEEITTTTVLDYAGSIVSANTEDDDDLKLVTSEIDPATGYYTAYTGYSRPKQVEDINDYYVGPKSGHSYQYYVVAYGAQTYSTANYFEDNPYKDPSNALDLKDANLAVYNKGLINVITPNTNIVSKGSIPAYDDGYTIESVGVKKVNTVTYTNASAPGKAKLKSVKSSKKKTVNITFKKVSGATSYKIYRSTKKKGKYTCVASVTKTKYADKTVESNKKYYYKVVAVKANEAGADVEGKASAVKAVKVK